MIDHKERGYIPLEMHHVGIERSDVLQPTFRLDDDGTFGNVGFHRHSFRLVTRLTAGVYCQINRWLKCIVKAFYQGAI